MSKLLRQLAIWVFPGVIIILPFVASAAGLVPCGGTPEGGSPEPPCDFDYLITLVNNIIMFLLYGVAVPLAALGFLWAGGSLIMSQNKASAWTEAKERFGNILLGFGIIAAAFILVKAFLLAFVVPKDGVVNFILGF